MNSSESETKEQTLKNQDSREEPRGLFPGLEFFNQLSILAKETTVKINEIDHSLNQPSKAHGLRTKADWSELQSRLNNLNQQTIDIKNNYLTKRALVSESLDILYNSFHWLSNETDRIENQFKQFGYKKNNSDLNFTYNKPLTPSMQEQLEIEQQKQKLLEEKIRQKYNLSNQQSNQQSQNSSQNISHTSSQDPIHQNIHKSQIQTKIPIPIHSQNKFNQNKNNIIQIQNNPNTQIQSQINPQNNTQLQIQSQSQSQSQNTNTKTNIQSQNNNSNSITTPIKPIQRIEQKKKIIPPTPKTPSLEDFGLSKYTSLYQSGKKDAGSKIQKSGDCRFGSIDENNPNSFNSNLKQDDNDNDNDNSNDEIDVNSLLAKYGCNLDSPIIQKNTPKQNNNSYLSSNKNKYNNRYSMESDYNDRIHSISVSAMTPSINKDNINENDRVEDKNLNDMTTQLDILAGKYGISTNNETDDDDEDTDIDMPIASPSISGGNVPIMSHITQNELMSVPTWIRGQLGDLLSINKSIDEINSFLETSHQKTMTKQEFSSLMQNSNEKPLILLLTRTNRLKGEWCDGVNVYKVVV